MGRVPTSFPPGDRRIWCGALPRRAIAVLCGGGLMLALLNPLAAGAQAVPEPQLRAAYLVNFLKYVE